MQVWYKGEGVPVIVNTPHRLAEILCRTGERSPARIALTGDEHEQVRTTLLSALARLDTLASVAPGPRAL